LKKLDSGDEVIIPAVDRLARETTDLLVIVRDIERAGAHLKSLAEPYIATIADAKEIVLAALGVAAKCEFRISRSKLQVFGPNSPRC
jgi:DNA invertase Pin-like site-specific DNA recombinase